MTTFGLTALPTNVDGSAGRDKADVRPVPDLGTHVSAAEWNTIKRAVVDLAAAMGRATGQDAGSIAAALLGATHGPRTDGWSVADDFLVSRGEAVKVQTGAGADAVLQAASSGEASAGVLLLSHGAVAGSAFWRPETLDLIAGLCNPICRVRFKTPADLTLSDFRIGLAKSDELNLAWIGWDHTSQLKLYLASQAGAASGNTNVLTLTTSTWYELEIRVVSGVSVGVYDSTGSLIVQDTTAGRALQTTDVIQPFASKITRVGAASSVLVDWFASRGGRS